MKMITAIGALLFTFSSSSNAQATQSGPRAGAWGAEVGFGGTATSAGGALLRFRNDRTAWVAGLDALFIQQDDGAGGDPATNIAIVGARVGIRSFRSPGSATRPILGAGILGGTTQRTGTQRTWDAGLYGELGIARFFGESFSVGAASELQLRRAETRFGGGSTTELRILFDAVRVAAAVYF